MHERGERKAFRRLVKLCEVYTLAINRGIIYVIY